MDNLFIYFISFFYISIKFEKEKGDENLSSQRGKGILYRMFKNIWAPILLSYPIRVLVLVVFFTWACISLALVPRISVGLDPETILPEDSYVARHFQVCDVF
jgi:Niemann-Pick C1 protein